MKSVLLNDDGYTADGQWRLVKIPEPATAAEDDFRYMIAASHAPELAEAVPVGYISREYLKLSVNMESKACVFISHKRDDSYIPLFTAPPAPAVPAVVVERLEGASIQARLSADANVLLEDGYSMRTANIKEAIERIAELEAENQALRADAGRYRALRDNPHGVSIACEYEWNIGASVFVNGAELDAAIDAAKGVVVKQG